MKDMENVKNPTGYSQCFVGYNQYHENSAAVSDGKCEDTDIVIDDSQCLDPCNTDPSAEACQVTSPPSASITRGCVAKRNGVNTNKSQLLHSHHGICMVAKPL